MNVGVYTRGRKGHWIRLVPLLAVVGCMGLVLPGASSATLLAPWGPDLSSGTASLDTANGDYSNNGILTSQYTAISPRPHDAADLAVWNSAYVAPQGGQVLE